MTFGSPWLQVFGVLHERYGISPMYTDINEHGWLWWAVSIPVYLLLWDAVFYVGHREWVVAAPPVRLAATAATARLALPHAMPLAAAPCRCLSIPVPAVVLHTDLVYRISHRFHHAFRPPTAWSGIAIDGIETFL